MEFKLFVSNVPYDCTEADFKTFMMTFDGVKDVKLISGKQTNPTNKGYGFVTVANKDVHDGFMSNENVVYGGRKLKFIDYVNQQKYYKLHVMNIPDTVTEENLFTTFAKYGKVDSAKKDYNFVTKQYKGTAVVVYDNYADFNTVLTMKNVPYTVASDKPTSSDATNEIMFSVVKRRQQIRKPFHPNFTKVQKLNRPLNIQKPVH